MKWYEQNYVNRRDWIMEHLGVLGLSAREAVTVLMIDYMNEHHMPVSMESLQKRTGLSEEETENAIDVLCARRYLDIKASSSGIAMLLNGLFEAETARDERILDNSLFETFESEFGRPLSTKEMQKISDWNRSMDKKMILYALREASAFQKLNLSYIDKILTEWNRKGITTEMIVNGKKRWKE